MHSTKVWRPILEKETAPRVTELAPRVDEEVADLVASLLEKSPRSRPDDALAVARTCEELAPPSSA